MVGGGAIGELAGFVDGEDPDKFIIPPAAVDGCPGIPDCGGCKADVANAAIDGLGY